MMVVMQMSVEELFVQTKLKYQFDSGYNQGYKEVKDKIILNMLKYSFDDELIMKYTHCTKKHLQEIKKIIQ